jgi:AcrR family transcriptional regulator
MVPNSNRRKPKSTPRVTLRETQKRSTRKLLLSRAHALFEHVGFERATMRDLAQRSGVALGTIFKHFPDKHALLGAAFREAIATQMDEAFATLPKGDLSTRLLHVTRCLYRFYAARPALARVLVKELPMLQGAEGEAVSAQALGFLQRVGVLFGEAIGDGELRRDTDLVTAVAAWWSFYFMGLLSGIAGPGFDVEVQVGLVERMLRQHLQGVEAQVPSARRRK